MWAIGGGPNQGGGASAASLVGSYAGALLPSSSSTTGTAQFNGLGLFTLSLPQSGLGNGDFIYFSEGKTFTGSITGLGDPNKQQFVGLVKAQFDIILSSFSGTDDFFGDFESNFTTPGGFANGTIKARFSAGSTPIVSAAGAAIAGLRLQGQAKLDISELTTTTTTDDNNTPDTTDDTTRTTSTVTTTSSLTLVVDGFQQSATSGTSLTGG